MHPSFTIGDGTSTLPPGPGITYVAIPATGWPGARRIHGNPGDHVHCQLVRFRYLTWITQGDPQKVHASTSLEAAQGALLGLACGDAAGGVLEFSR